MRSFSLSVALLALVACAEPEPAIYGNTLSIGSLALTSDGTTWSGTEEWAVRTADVDCDGVWDIEAVEVGGDDLQLEVVAVDPRGACATDHASVPRVEVGQLLTFVPHERNPASGTMFVSDPGAEDAFVYASAVLADGELVYRAGEDPDAADPRDLREPGLQLGN